MCSHIKLQLANDFFPALLRYNWYITSDKLRCAMWWFDRSIYCEVFTTLINTSFTSHNYHFVVTVRTLKLYAHSNLQICNIVLLTIVIMLYIRSPELTLQLKVGTLWPTSAIFPSLQPLTTTILLSVSMSSQDMETIWVSINQWKDKENIYIYNALLFSHKKEGNSAICDKMVGSWGHYVK